MSSWWVGVPREQFSQCAAKEVPRMAASREARVYTLTAIDERPLKRPQKRPDALERDDDDG